MAPNSASTLLFALTLKEAEVFPTAIDLDVFLTHSTTARTQTVTLADGEVNLTLDAGIVRTVGSEQTPTPTNLTSLPEEEQPQESQQRMEMFLPLGQCK